jgi:lysophospholipase L1-like esterase
MFYMQGEIVGGATRYSDEMDLSRISLIYPCLERKMPRPIQHTVGAVSAADFDNMIRMSYPNIETEPLFFAEGDSWFNKFYPSRGNLLEQLDLPRGCHMLDHSWSGDWADDMFAPHRIAAAAQYLDAYPFKAILLSAGGNDIIGNIGALLNGTGNNATLSDSAVNDAFDRVESLIRNFCTARSQSTQNADTRVFIHAYDYLTPRNAPVKGKIAGPWVYPRLRAKGVDDATKQKALVTELLDKWLARLTAMATLGSPKHIAGFHVLVTLGMLTPANAADTGRSNDWEDEIHPSVVGYRKIAARLVNPVLRGVLAGA